MIDHIKKDDINLLKSVIKPGIFVVTKSGISKVLNTMENNILTINDNNEEFYYDYTDVIPIMKGFFHLTLMDLYTITDLITGRSGYGNYKPNYNFLPHFYEITEESIDLKVQIYHNFDIIHCDNLLTNIGKAYYYLTSRHFDIYNLQEKGLAIIDPVFYGTDRL